MPNSLAKSYAEALENSLMKGEKNADEIISGLARHLKAVGKLKLLSPILSELKKTVAHAEAGDAVVEVAHEKDAPAALAEASKHGIKASHAKTVPSLISGWRAYKKGTLVDRSGKRFLLEIYQNAVK
jgi:hypothetical protein